MIYKEISEIASKINNGNVGIFPAKNGYMLIGQYNNSSVINRIREIKGKSQRKPLVNVIFDISDLEELKIAYQNLNPLEKNLINTFKYSDFIFGFHLPNIEKDIEKSHMTSFTFAKSPFERLLAQELHYPFVASSANVSGEKTPYTAEQIDHSIVRKADFVFNIGKLESRPDYFVLDLDEKHSTYRDSTYYKFLNKFIEGNEVSAEISE